MGREGGVSFYADIPANGGTLGDRLLKGMQLPIDCPTDKLVAPAPHLAHDMAVVNVLFSFPLFLNIFHPFGADQQLYYQAD